jgi:hypothetical protein
MDEFWETLAIVGVVKVCSDINTEREATKAERIC